VADVLDVETRGGVPGAKVLKVSPTNSKAIQIQNYQVQTYGGGGKINRVADTHAPGWGIGSTQEVGHDVIES